MKIQVNGDTFSGTAGEIVHQMSESAYLSEDSDEDYTRAVARRLKLLKGADIDTATPEAFLRDLDRVGFCQIIDPD